tara:strand:- start:280 stop:1788 length:1509 start_codon:yes stop_codon:yes gene_type:complete
MKKNVVVIGAGINGLVVSNYLQKNDFQVLLIEKNDHVGGACVKDSINYNNEKILYPKGATVLGMMQKFIFNETGLSNHVETFYPKTPKLVYFPGDKDPTRIFQDIKDLEIELKAKWNEDGDVEGFRNDENKVIDFIQNLYRNGDSPNVEKATETLGNKLTHLWIKGSAYDLLNNYFNSEKTKLYMGMTVTESGPASIYDEGTAFTIPLMDSGSIFNGYWGFVKQGIWEITEKLDSINRALGVDTILSANIIGIDTNKKKIYLKNKVIEFDILVFATDPKTPSLLLNEDNSYNKILDKEFIGTSGKVTAFFKNPVRWKNNKNKDYDSTFRFIFSNTSLNDFEKSSQNAKKNIGDYNPGYIQIYPEGAAQRKMGNTEKLDKLILFTKNFSFDKNGSSLSHSKDEVISLLSNYIENIDDLTETVFLTPKDLSDNFYFPKGNIDHMTLTKNQNFDNRTFSENPSTDFYQYFHHKDTYYCGAGSFPCGSVAGTPGYMCSKQIVKKYS